MQDQVGIADPRIIAVKLNEVHPCLWEKTLHDRYSQLNDGVSIRERQMIGLGRMNQLVPRCIAYIDEERNPSQPVEELREHAKSSLRVWIVRGADGIEEAV